MRKWGLAVMVLVLFFGLILGWLRVDRYFNALLSIRRGRGVNTSCNTSGVAKEMLKAQNQVST